MPQDLVARKSASGTPCARRFCDATIADMIPSAAWSARRSGNTTFGPGPLVILLALWDHAHRYHRGEVGAFVFPSVGSLMRKLGLGRSTIYRGLGELERAGWIVADRDDENRTGWWLSISPMTADGVDAVPIDAEPDDTVGAQLGFAWAHEDAMEVVDSLGSAQEAAAAPSPTLGTAEVQPLGRLQCVAGNQSENVHPQRDDDEALHVWQDYEAERVRALGRHGAKPHRGEPTPRGLRALQALHASLGGDGDAWRRISAHGTQAIRQAADAIEKGRDMGPNLVHWRADGDEWKRSRYDGVTSWGAVTTATPAPSAPPMLRARPPADHFVDDEIVSRDELDALEAGGADAVRAVRQQRVTLSSITRMMPDWLRSPALAG